MSDIKQTNFRIGQDDAGKFREFCETNGFSQAQGFEQLLRLLELEKAREIIPGRAMEIDEFSLHTKAIMNAFLNSLEINANAEARIREEFNLSLQSKDKTIADLQEKVELLKAAKDEAEQAASSASQAAAQATKDSADAMERAATVSKLAEEKDKTVNSLAEKLTATEEKLAGYSDLEKEAQELKEQLKVMKREITDLKKDYEIKLRELNAEMARKISDTEKDAALAAATAVAEKEREIRDIYEDKLRVADRENAKLQIMVEQMEKREKK